MRPRFALAFAAQHRPPCAPLTGIKQRRADGQGAAQSERPCNGCRQLPHPQGNARGQQGLPHQRPSGEAAALGTAFDQGTPQRPQHGKRQQAQGCGPGRQHARQQDARRPPDRASGEQAQASQPDGGRLQDHSVATAHDAQRPPQGHRPHTTSHRPAKALALLSQPQPAEQHHAPLRHLGGLRQRARPAGCVGGQLGRRFRQRFREGFRQRHNRAIGRCRQRRAR